MCKCAFYGNCGNVRCFLRFLYTYVYSFTEPNDIFSVDRLYKKKMIGKLYIFLAYVCLNVKYIMLSNELLASVFKFSLSLIDLVRKI